MFAKVYQYKFGTVSEAKVAASFCADSLGKKISKFSANLACENFHKLL